MSYGEKCLLGRNVSLREKIGEKCLLGRKVLGRNVLGRKVFWGETSEYLSKVSKNSKFRTAQMVKITLFRASK